MRFLPLLLAAAPCALLLAFATPDDDELHTAMEGIKASLKTLATSVSDPAQNEQSLEAVTQMQIWALKAKLQAPQNLGEVAEDERAAHVAAFRADMLRLIIELAELEIDVLEGNNDEANDRVRTTLYHMREGAHEKYQSH